MIVYVLLLGIAISENLDIKNKGTKINIPVVAIYESRVLSLRCSIETSHASIIRAISA